jgi:hypothetical protein
MTYHVGGCKDFRSNELGFGPEHDIVCWNEAISDKCVALGMERNAMETGFCLVP